MKCTNCGIFLSGKRKRCPECGTSCAVDNVDISNIGNCEICGRRGRKIELAMGKERRIYYRCYECNVEETTRNSYKAEKRDLSQVELDYYQAVEEYYLKPLFWGKAPNLEALAKFADAMTNFQLSRR